MAIVPAYWDTNTKKFAVDAQVVFPLNATLANIAANTVAVTGPALAETTDGKLMFLPRGLMAGAGSNAGWVEVSNITSANITDATATGRAAITAADAAALRDVAGIDQDVSTGSSPTFFDTNITMPAEPLLDQVGSAAVAVGFDRLSSDTVYSVRLRRSIDDLEMDFAPEGILLAAVAFAGAGDAHVVRLYDQTGNDRHLQQTDPAKQRRCVIAGVPVTLLGKIAMEGAALTGAGYDFASGVTVSGAFSVFALAENQLGFTEGLLGTSNSQGRVRWDAIEGGLEVSGGTSLGYSFAFASQGEDAHLLTLIRDASNVTTAGIRKTTNATTRTIPGSLTWVKGLSRNGDLNPFFGKFRELVIYASDRTADLDTIRDEIYGRHTMQVPVAVMSGQSNMQGRAVNGTSVSSAANDATIYEYNDVEGATARQSFASYYAGSTYGKNRYGPNVGFGRELAASGYAEPHIIRYAKGGHSLPAFLPEADRLYSPQDELPGTNADQWAGALSFVNAALTNMDRTHFRQPASFVWVWYQGAEDSKHDGLHAFPHDLAGLYAAHLNLLRQRVRENYTGFTPQTSAIIIRSPDWNSNTPGSKPYQDEVRSAQVTSANIDSRSIWVDSDAPGGVTATWEDGSHIDAATQDRLGVDVADAYLENFAD